MPGFGKDGKGQILYSEVSGSAITLANANTVEKLLTLAATEDFRLLKAELYLCIAGIAAGNADDPILVGIADAELSATEIEEALKATPTDRNDNALLERTHRPVWPLGWLMPDGITADSATRYGTFTWSQRWTFSGDDGWCLWYYNLGDANMAGTPELHCLCKWYGVWVS